MRLGAIVLDSDNIEKLSDFYAAMLGWKRGRIAPGLKDPESIVPGLTAYRNDLNLDEDVRMVR